LDKIPYLNVCIIILL